MSMTTGNENALFDAAEVQRGLELLAPAGQVVEVRVLDAKVNGDRFAATLTGYFDDPAKVPVALKDVREAVGFYFTINPVDQRLKARACNRLKRAGKGDSTSDKDIERRRVLLIDCDAVRPAGISSNDAEHDAAIKKAKSIADDLHYNYGWPDPVLCDSGNGAHLNYLIDEPRDDNGLVERSLKSLSAKHSDGTIKVDTSCFNPARISKLYGTVAGKGDSIAERPHRPSRVLMAPVALIAVSHEQLEALASEAPAAETKAPTSRQATNGDAFDIDGFVQRNGLVISKWGPYQDGRRCTFNRSPLCDHHDDGPYLVQFGSGALAAGCHHDSCDWGWVDLRARFEPKPDRQNREHGQHHEPTRAAIEIVQFGDLRVRHPHLNPTVIEGLLRQGETGNVISYSKIGKSWMMYDLALSLITGRPWLGRFNTSPGKVLYIDNELHRCTLADRIPKVAYARNLPDSSYEQDLAILSLRGNLRSLADLGCDLDALSPGEFQAIVLDAKYRFAIAGVSENDNAAETMLYNELDRISDKTKSAIILVHHASKGAQTDKRVTDVGAGAGAQSRAADCHIVLREHEDPGVVVLEAAVRSFAPVEPLSLRWEFPLWQPAFDIDPSKLKGRQGKQEERQSQKDTEGAEATLTALVDGSATARQLRRMTGFGEYRQKRLIDLLIARGDIIPIEVKVGSSSHEEFQLK